MKEEDCCQELNGILANILYCIFQTNAHYATDNTIDNYTDDIRKNAVQVFNFHKGERILVVYHKKALHSCDYIHYNIIID